MAIDGDGMLLRAYQDTCSNYKPNKNKPSGVKSIQLGMIFDCTNYNFGDNSDRGCFECINKDYKV